MMISYLNTENISRNKDGIEYHPLRPFLPEDAKVLFLGSFPPQRKRWCMDFYYPNFINDHWRIEGQIFYGDKNHFVNLEAKRFKIDEIVEFCKEHHLAFFDTSTAIRRLQDNASDKYLEVVEPTDIRALLQQLPYCQAIVTTGEKATETICISLNIPIIPKVNNAVAIPHTYNRNHQQILLYRLPSSSRAYPLSFDKKVEAYRQMFSIIEASSSFPSLPPSNEGNTGPSENENEHCERVL
jgi:G:T/U-mismatch repair DNA glycosylase